MSAAWQTAWKKFGRHAALADAAAERRDLEYASA
jgi:hypothetical protein